jgi:acetoin:2,6-dichlorophenolindophenol oxidoreductase subunit alpha
MGLVKLQAADAPARTNRPDAEEMLLMYRRMVLVRGFEERLGLLHREGRTRGPIHRCDGQEAVGIGATFLLRPTDTIASTHRGHAHFIGKGLDLRRVAAEILGRASGYCGGRAGHMLIADRTLGVVGGNAIVGAGIAIALGHALAHEARGAGDVAVAFFGDGAAQNGLCHEAMNMAGLWRLPIIFVCENNGYGLTVPTMRQSAVDDLAKRAEGYSMPGVVVDGNDVVAVYRALDRALGRARSGAGPTFIEAKTYRLSGFSTSDLGGYQPKEEVAEWRTRDPIARLKTVLMSEHYASAVAEAEAAAEEILEAALAAALADPLPDPAALWPASLGAA